MAPRGKLIVFEGLDRVGKSTQAEMLRQQLELDGQKVVLLKFPDRTTPIGKIINQYLTHEIELDDHAIHLLFSANRWELLPTIKSHLDSNTTVILDRYLYSGAVYSAAKQIPSLSLAWATNPDIGLPRPDLLVFLDLDPATARDRAGYGDERYEKVELQTRVKTLFRQLLGFESDTPPARTDVDVDVDVDGSTESDGDDVLRVDAVGTLEELHEYIYRRVKRRCDAVDRVAQPVGTWSP